MTQPSKILCLAVFVATLLLPARAAAQVRNGQSQEAP
jgi:hypothetical protein